MTEVFTTKQLIITVVCTTLIIIFSWTYSIRDKRYHGIARFFSFESITILVIMNIRYWFRDPLSTTQLLSWIFLIISVYPGLAGYLTLRNHGKAENNFENTTVLVKRGIYRYIRHPLYCSLLLFGTGVMFKNPGNIQISLGLINLAAVWITAKTEEKEMLQKFGNEYAAYMKESKMFIPGLF
jgi:protein-S-isoprenylcysteine O-methyltransferase Ste14